MAPGAYLVCLNRGARLHFARDPAARDWTTDPEAGHGFHDVALARRVAAARGARVLTRTAAQLSVYVGA